MTERRHPSHSSDRRTTRNSNHSEPSASGYEDRWKQQPEKTESRKVLSPETAAEIMRLHLGFVRDEHMVVILLDAQDHEIATLTVAEGTPDTCVASVEKIMREAIWHEARGVIMGHNHPSGRANPSPQDLAFFERLKQAFALLDHTRLLDCIIIGDQTNELYSLRRSTYRV